MALKTYNDIEEVAMHIYQIEKLFNKLSIPYTINEIDEDTLYISAWHGSENLKMRFVRDKAADNFYLTGFLEG